MSSDHSQWTALNWLKSSYSAGHGSCVEVAQVPADFRKSSYSGGSGGSCVEVADTPRASAVHDTQNRELGALSFASAEWRAFLTAAKHDAL